MSNGYKPRLLKLAEYHDKILRTKTQPVQFPLSITDQQIIADMKYSIQPEQLLAAGAPWDGAVGMAANQWGIDKSIFLYCPSGDTVNDLEVIINPSYSTMPTSVISVKADDYECEWEGCFSVPGARGNIKRHKRVSVQYQNEQGTVIERELNGWEARVWQHENDHLNGLLYDDVNAGKCLEKTSADKDDEG